MIAYLGLFSTSFIIAMVLWPFAAAVLALPILAGLYHRHHRLRLTADSFGGAGGNPETGE
ncbi:hypothetical protein [Bifidobacterium eulemuris]|uniref:hypothetical protein n=1 Tax=Bifidobacterium eulemuris TaxID=1765219 RepID=UPI001FCEE93A|nr:hypothetical protein [Bifidobacterium eulemuris]